MWTQLTKTAILLSLAAVATPVAAQLPGLQYDDQVEAPERSPEEVIEAQLAAFNAHDVDALVANLADGFAWFAVDTDVMTVELEGRSDFYDSMRGYFEQLPSARAEIDEMFVVGNFVTVKERAFWFDGQQEVSQAALAVYEVRNGLIYRVWYYPAFE